MFCERVCCSPSLLVISYCNLLRVSYSDHLCLIILFHHTQTTPNSTTVITMSLRPERKVPVVRSDFNLIDSEFSSVRERFEAEMRKMEDEMNRFRSQLQDRERDFFGGSSGALTSQQRTTSSHTSSTLGGDAGPTHRSELTTWLDGLNSPLVQDTDDGKALKLRFDVTQYAPEEIVVKTVDNRLQVSFSGYNDALFSLKTLGVHLVYVLFALRSHPSVLIHVITVFFQAWNRVLQTFWSFFLGILRVENHEELV